MTLALLARLLLGTILLALAGLKLTDAQALAESPLLMAVTIVEAVLGLWVLASWRAAYAFRCAAVFGILLCVGRLVGVGLSDSRSGCGCLGHVQIHEFGQYVVAVLIIVIAGLGSLLQSHPRAFSVRSG
jgi:hypothetical protein